MLVCVWAGGCRRREAPGVGSEGGCALLPLWECTQVAWVEEMEGAAFAGIEAFQRGTRT